MASTEITVYGQNIEQIRIGKEGIYEIVRSITGEKKLFTSGKELPVKWKIRGDIDIHLDIVDGEVKYITITKPGTEPTPVPVQKPIKAEPPIESTGLPSGKAGEMVTLLLKHQKFIENDIGTTNWFTIKDLEHLFTTDRCPFRNDVIKDSNVKYSNNVSRLYFNISEAILYLRKNYAIQEKYSMASPKYYRFAAKLPVDLAKIAKEDFEVMKGTIN